MSMIDPARWLAVWETGARRHPVDRALLLFALAAPEIDADSLADAPLGARNAAIMNLRQRCFGRRLPAWLDCPACGERMEFELDPDMLPAMPDGRPSSIELSGLRFLAPSSRTLQAMTHTADEQQAALGLLRACLDPEQSSGVSDADLLPLIDPVGAALDDADPWADLELTMPCPACATPVTASFDIALYFWDELERHVQTVLDDVHDLASAYGWSEAQILALSETRRAAYLARARA